jgi:hypothetical protein
LTSYIRKYIISIIIVYAKERLFMKQFPAHIVAVDGIIDNENNEILLIKAEKMGIHSTGRTSRSW